MDAVRLNLSHDTHSTHRKTFDRVRSIDDTIPVIFDIQGPKVRIGEMKKPVELDKEYEADIEDLSRRGDGVAKIEGYIIFVPNAKKGDHVKFKVTRVGSRFATGELVAAESE